MEPTGRIAVHAQQDETRVLIEYALDAEEAALLRRGVPTVVAEATIALPKGVPDVPTSNVDRRLSWDRLLPGYEQKS